MTERKKRPRPNELYAAHIAVWLREASGVVPWRDVQDSKLHRYELGATLFERYANWCEDMSRDWEEGKPGALPVFPASPVAFYRALERSGLDRHVLAGHLCFLCAKQPYPAPNKFRRRVVTSAMLAGQDNSSTGGHGSASALDDGQPVRTAGRKIFLAR